MLARPSRHQPASRNAASCSGRRHSRTMGLMVDCRGEGGCWPVVASIVAELPAFILTPRLRVALTADTNAEPADPPLNVTGAGSPDCIVFDPSPIALMQATDGEQPRAPRDA